MATLGSPGLKVKLLVGYMEDPTINSKELFGNKAITEPMCQVYSGEILHLHPVPAGHLSTPLMGRKIPGKNKRLVKPCLKFNQKKSSWCLEPETSVYKWLFQVDDSKSLYRKWLFHQTSI